MGKFTLKKLSVNEALSEETLCFSADLYEDGKLIAHIGNRGRGGSNDITPPVGKNYKDVAYLDNFDTECEILELAENMNIVKKHQTKSLVLKKGHELSTVTFKHSIAKLKKVPNTLRLLKEKVEHYKGEGYEVLNTNI